MSEHEGQEPHHHHAGGRRHARWRLVRLRRRHAFVLLLIAAFLLVVPAVALLWKGAALRGWAASRIVFELQLMLHADVTIGKVDLAGGMPPRIIIRDVRISREGRVIASAKRVVAEPRIGPLLAGQLDLATLVLQGLALDVTLSDLAPQAGAPVATKSSDSRIEMLLIRDASISLRDPATGFELDVPHAAGMSSGFMQAGRIYLRVEGTGARVAWKGRVVQPVDVSARLQRDEKGIRLDDVRIVAPGVSAWIDASLDLPPTSEPGATPTEPTLQLHVDADVQTVPLVAQGFLPAPTPVGSLSWSGDVRATRRGWAASGTLTSDLLEARTDLRPIPALADLEAKVKLSTAAMEVEELSARVGSGHVDGTLRATRGKEGWLLAGSLQAEGVRVAELPLPRDLDARRPPVDGAIGIDIDGVVPLWDPAAAKLTWTLGIAPGRGSDATIALVGEGKGSVRSRRVEIESLGLSAAGGDLELTGSVGFDATLALTGSLTAARLSDARTALAPFAPSVAGMPLDLAGALVATGTVDGTLTAPRIDAVLTGRGLYAFDTQLGDLDGHLAWDGALVADARIEGPVATILVDDVRSAPQGGIQGRWELLSGQASALGGTAGLPDMSGELRGSGSFAVVQHRRVIEGAVEGESLTFAGQSLDRLELEGSSDETGVEIGRLVLTREGGRIAASGAMPWHGERGQATVTITSWPVEIPVAGAPLSGTITTSAELRGSVDAPRLAEAAAVTLSDVRWHAFGPLSFEGRAGVVDDVVTATLTEPGSGAEVHASISREEDWPTTLTATIPNLVMPLPTGMTGRRLDAMFQNATLELHGPLKDPKQLQFTGEATGFQLVSANWTAEGIGPVKLAGTSESVALEPARLSLFGSEFSVGGAVRLAQPPRWDVDAEGEVSLAGLEVFVPEARIAGTARVTLKATGTGKESSLDGDVTIHDGYLNHPALRHSLRAVEAHLAVSSGHAHLDRLEGVLGGGRVTATGEADLEGWKPSTWSVAAKGESVALRIPADVRTVSDFDLRLSQRGEDVRLEGDVHVLRGRYTGAMQLGSGPHIARLRAPGPLDHLLLDLHLDANDQFVVDDDLLRAEFRANLDIVGTGSHPVVLGSLDAVRAGLLFYKKTTFDLTDASLVFTRAFPNDPELDAHAHAHVGLHEVELGLSGRAGDPIIDLSSQPELPQESLAAMLATSGMLSTEVGQLGAQLPAPFASSRAGWESPLTTAGLDPLRLDPVLVEGTALPSARLTLGRQITPRLFAGYSLSLRGDQAGTVELRYRVKPRLELRLAVEEGGTNIEEARWTRSWHAHARPAAATATAAPAATVGALNVVGVSDPSDKAAVVTALDLPAGHAADRSSLLRAAGDARVFLVEHDHPLARVECAADTDVAEGPVDVTCSVDPGTRVVLVVTGASEGATKAVRQAVLDSWAELAFADELVPAAAVAAQDALLARGLARATVRGTSEEIEDGLEVHITADPGDVVRVGDVAIDGAVEIPVKELRSELVSAHRQGFKRPKVTPALLSGDAGSIESAYQSEGFLDAKVPDPAVTYPTDAPQALVTYNVEEGERQRVVGVVFEGNQLITTEDLQKEFPLAIGDVARPEKLDAFVRQVSQDLDAKGRPDASVSWRLRRVEGGAIVECIVSEGPEVRLGEVRIVGLERTRERIVRREIHVEPGEPFSRTALVGIRRRVSDLGLFQSVVVRGEPRTDDPSTRDVLVRVSEKPDLDLSIGVGVEDLEPRASIAFGQRNVGGIGVSFGVQAQAAGDDRLLRFLSGVRRVGGTKNDLLLVLGYERATRPAFTSDKNFMGVQMTRALSPTITLLPRIRWEDVTIPKFDVSPAEAKRSEGIVAGPGVALLRETRDDPIWPHRGSLASFDVSYSGEQFGADHSFTKTFAQYSVARSFWARGLIAAGSVRMGAAWTFDQSKQLPLSERFFAGGVGSVRGWRTDHLGPRDPLTNEPVGGDAVLVLNAELRIPVTRHAWFIAFADAGNVYSRASALTHPGLEYTAGPGVAVSTPVGPLRFFYGRKLHDVPGESPGEFHFTFGTTF